nr:AgmX/PglI C-terminal domain-containing protein [Deltaproteobacteria bacterium]
STGFDDSNTVYGPLFGSKASSGSSGGGGRFGAGSGRGMIRARVATPPAVHIAMPVVQGSLDKNIIKRYIKRNINRISYCYERELLAKPTLEGTVSTQFLIEAGGKVKSATATGVDETVAKCVADVIKTIEFPTVTDGTVQVNYPFNFRIAGSSNDDDEVLAALAAAPAPRPDTNVAVAPLPPAVELPPPPPPPLGDDPLDALDGKLQIVMKSIRKKDTAGALDFATKWRNSQPGDVLAWIGLGEALEASGDRAGAARAYGSIIDLFGARAEYRRFAGERLERTGERKLTIDTYRRAVADRPDQLTGHRLLAYALLRDGDQAGAFAAILAGVDQTLIADRYAGAPAIFARDAGMIGTAYIAAHLENKDHVMAALRKRSLSLVTQPSTRFLLYWETDANDVDLHIRDKNGNEASFSNKTLASGGELFADVTTGFGPECFEINGKLPAPPYELGVHYYAQGPMGYGMGLLQIERFDGRGFTFEDRPYIIMRDDARISLGKVR